MRFSLKARIVYTLPVWCVAFTLVLFGAGCGSVRMESTGDPAVPSVSSVMDAARDGGAARAPLLTRESLSDGIEHISYSFATSSEVRLELYGFPQEQYRFHLAAGTERTISEWQGSAAPSVAAGINAMYFLEDFSPAGFLVTDGVEQRDHPFDWDLSALLVIDEEDGLAIRPTTEEPEDLDTLTHAGQSYPLLVLNGEPLLETDSGKVSRRSIVGTDADGRVWIGVLLDGSVSLYELGQRMMELQIPWEQVLNLDGGSSSGMFVRKGATVLYPSFKPVPSVLFVEMR